MENKQQSRNKEEVFHSLNDLMAILQKVQEGVVR